MQRYSNLDSVSKTWQMLRDADLLSPEGEVRGLPSPHDGTCPPEPFKLAQRFDQATITEIITKYRAGKSSPELARRYGLSKNSVIKLLRDAAVPIRNQGLTAAQIAEAARLYASGQSLAQIGAHLGVDHGTVWRQLRKRGVKMRDTHGRKR